MTNKNDLPEAEIIRLDSMMEFERKYADFKYICGIDEVGRGPLAGPVVACAVILPKEAYYRYLNDSKKVTEKRREKLYDEITNEAVAFGMPEFMMLSANCKAMMTIALCGFAGIGSIGILIGSYQAIAPNKVKVVARIGFKALIVATLVNIMTAAVVGIIL